MKRLIACVSLVAAASTAAAPATAPPHPAAKAPAKQAKHVAKAPPRCKVAPADEYFGKLKLSILGIRNTIKDQSFKVDADPDKAPTTLNAIALTEDAVHDWQRKYPCDGWLPGSIYALQHFYTKIHTGDGVKHVHATFAWLRHDFPKSRLVMVALKEDGSATAISPPMAAAPSGVVAVPATGTTVSTGPAPAASAQPMPGQGLATPIPGTAPASVINAQNAMGAPSPAPH